jgi:hypothetical protein
MSLFFFSLDIQIVFIYKFKLINYEKGDIVMKKIFLLVLNFLLALTFVAEAGAIEPAPANTARFYQDYQCTSPPYIEFSKGTNVPDLRKWTIPAPGGPSWNDQISCIVIGEGVSKVIVYQDINYKGKSKTFTRTANNPLGAWSLAQDWWNDKISSIKVQ